MHFTDSYFNSGKIKDESMNTRSNLRAMGETIGFRQETKSQLIQSMDKRYRQR